MGIFYIQIIAFTSIFQPSSGKPYSPIRAGVYQHPYVSQAL